LTLGVLHTHAVIVGWVLLGASALLWAWIMRRASRANPRSPLSYFGKPSRMAPPERILAGTATGAMVAGYLLIAMRTHGLERWLALLVMVLIGLLLVALPIATHNRRVNS
jgi:hypothetical protein